MSILQTACQTNTSKLLEPISKSFEEDNEAGKLDKAEEVVPPANEGLAGADIRIRRRGARRHLQPDGSIRSQEQRLEQPRTYADGATWPWRGDGRGQDLRHLRRTDARRLGF